MSIDSKGTFGLHECVTSVIELRHISSKVLDESEFASRMLSFITIGVQDQIVKDD